MTINRYFTLRAGEVQAIGLGLAIKTVVSLIMLFFFYQFSDFDRVYNLWNRYFTGEGNVTAWYLPFANWDSQHYLLLSEYGYDHGRDSTGSRQAYPLYPLLMRPLNLIVSPWVSALLLNYVFVAGLCVFLYRIGEHFQCKNTQMVILLMLTFPSAFFTSAIYTESLFLFLQMGFFYHLLITRSRARLVYLALLPLARGSAVFVFGGLMLYALVEYVRVRTNVKSETGKSIKRKQWRRRRRVRAHAASLPRFNWGYHFVHFPAFLVGALGYLLIMTIATGNPLAVVKGQGMILHANSIGNLINPLHFIDLLFSSTRGWFLWPSIFDRAMLVLMLGGIGLFLFYKEWTLLCFYLPIIYGHAAMSGALAGYLRFALLAAPFLVLALVKNCPRRWIIYTVCAAAFFLQLCFAYRFSLNRWVA